MKEKLAKLIERYESELLMLKGPEEFAFTQFDFEEYRDQGKTDQLKQVIDDLKFLIDNP
jgi:hypothetical protein